MRCSGIRSRSRAWSGAAPRSADPVERDRAYEAAVAAAYETGKGLNMAAYFEIDDVIDPAESRRWIATLFDSPRSGPGRPYVDAW